MNVVIYEADLNPLTIIELPLAALEQGARMGTVRFVPTEGWKDYEPWDRISQSIAAFTMQFLQMKVGDHRGFAIVALDGEFKTWLVPVPGTPRATQKFLENRSYLARGLRSVLAHGVGGH